MSDYEERTYRNITGCNDLLSFNVAVKETDLWISCNRELEKDTRDLIINYRNQLETYIRSYPLFLTTLESYPEDVYAPRIVQDMILATGDLNVGPMASVAGAMAQYVGKGLLEKTDQVIVENGGDIFLKADRDITVSMLAGDSPLSGKLGIRVPVKRMPCGICSSSGKTGHSLSLGQSDVVCLVSSSSIRADGAATAVGNILISHEDLEKAANTANEIEGISGGVVIIGEKMATWGEIELVEVG
jgi:ApbE superfamily uncharacterized protein (UPF0280 family)